MTRISPSKEIVDLIIACLHDIADEQQQKRLADWLAESEANKKFYEHLKTPAYRKAAFHEYSAYDSHQDWPKVKVRLHPHPKAIAIYRKLWPYAAILVLSVGIACIGIFRATPSKTQTQTALSDITPGKAKARLILDNGKTIELAAAEGAIPQKVEGECFINDGQRLVYTGQPDKKAAKTHILQIPRGGEYSLILADGTRVWLNAESELKYPDHFAATQRQVELSGEAYFEVAKDSARPFYVLTGDLKVKVLGTSFNIRAYPDEIKQTTLAEGRVMLDYNGQHLEIRPGEQASVTPEGMKVAHVKVGNYTGWKEQRFIYEDKALEEVIKDLGRWYDVEIFISNQKIYDLRLTANLPKYENMDKVLEIIECAACVKFDIKGRTLTLRADH